MSGYRAALVAPVGAPPIADGAVVLDGERIAWVGPAAQAPGGALTDLGDALITPGLVNAHTHLDLTAYRGVLDGLAMFPWIRTLTLSKTTLTGAQLLDSARLGIADGLARGITTYADTANTTAAFDAMHELGVRGIAYLEVFGPDGSQAPEKLSELAAQVAALRSRATERVQLGVSPHAPYSVSDALFAAVSAYAAREGLPLAVHIAEGADESQLVALGLGPWAEFLRSRGISVAPRGRSPVSLLATLGVLGDRALLIHAVHADAADLASIAQHGCGVAHCPWSNAWFDHGTAPVAAMLARGVRVGIGSDSMGSNVAMDVLAEAASALAAQRALARTEAEADALHATDALTMATLGGARALHMEHQIGTLSPGYAADLAVFPLPVTLDRAHGPTTRGVSEALAAQGAAAQLVVVAGAPVFTDGTARHADTRMTERVAAVTEQLFGWRSEHTSG